MAFYGMKGSAARIDIYGVDAGGDHGLSQHLLCAARTTAALAVLSLAWNGFMICGSNAPMLFLIPLGVMAGAISCGYCGAKRRNRGLISAFGCCCALNTAFVFICAMIFISVVSSWDSGGKYTFSSRDLDSLKVCCDTTLAACHFSPTDCQCASLPDSGTLVLAVGNAACDSDGGKGDGSGSNATPPLAQGGGDTGEGGVMCVGEYDCSAVDLSDRILMVGRGAFIFGAIIMICSCPLAVLATSKAYQLHHHDGMAPIRPTHVIPDGHAAVAAHYGYTPPGYGGGISNRLLS